MKQETHYIKLAKQELGPGAKQYNNVELAIFGADIHKQKQSNIDKLFNLKINVKIL
jgi:hypothetical protein